MIAEFEKAAVSTQRCLNSAKHFVCVRPESCRLPVELI